MDDRFDISASGLLWLPVRFSSSLIREIDVVFGCGVCGSFDAIFDRRDAINRLDDGVGHKYIS